MKPITSVCNVQNDSYYYNNLELISLGECDNDLFLFFISLHFFILGIYRKIEDGFECLKAKFHLV